MKSLVAQFSLENKVIVVTGAAGQLGVEFCTKLKDAGAKVVGFDFSETSVHLGSEAEIDLIKVDVSKRDSVRSAFSKVVEKYGRIDSLVNNAGVAVFSPFEERSEEELDRVIGVNIKGTFNCIQAYIDWYDKQKLTEGSIVNIASHYGVVSPDFRIYTDCARKSSEIYGATKAGVIQMTRYFAVHLAARGIRVNAVSPGGVFNPKAPQGDDFRENYGYRCPMKRMGNADEMSGAVVYLLSKASSYTNGTNIVIDGGFSCW